MSFGLGTFHYPPPEHVEELVGQSHQGGQATPGSSPPIAVTGRL
jgi:hypothetical protein